MRFKILAFFWNFLYESYETLQELLLETLVVRDIIIQINITLVSSGAWEYDVEELKITT